MNYLEFSVDISEVGDYRCLGGLIGDQGVYCYCRVNISEELLAANLDILIHIRQIIGVVIYMVLGCSKHKC